MYDEFKALRIDQRGAELWITLDNPPMNAMSADMHTELAHIFRVASRDPQVRVVVVTGAGTKGFSAGGDINDFARGLHDYESWVAGLREAREIILSMLECDKPVVARINGHAIGVGASIALCCDVTIMVQSAKFGDTHVKVGLSAGDGGSLLWPHLVGLMTARRYLLTGDLLTGAEAAQIGLITKAVPAEQLDEEVESWAKRFANGPLAAISGTKRSLNMAIRQEAQLFMDAQLGLETNSKLSLDHGEAVHAFIEKREPNFQGR